MDRSSLGRSLRLSVAEGGLATAMGSLFSGIFLTGFAVSLDASRLQIGTLFALPALCGVAQLAGSWWMERGGQARRLCLLFTLLSRLLYLPVLLVPLLATGLSTEAKVWWVIGLMAISNLLGSLSGVAWLTWIKALVPANLRVAFFGRRNLVNTALSFGVCLAGGLLVDAWGSGDQARIVGFSVVFLIAMSCGLVSWFLMTRIQDGEPVKPPENPASFLPLLAAPLREGNFRRVVLFYTVWNLAVNVAAPFIPVFFMQKLGLPFWYVIALSTLSSVMGLVANNFWVALAQRFGLKPVVMLATLGEAIFPLSLVLVTPQWSWILLVIHLTGIFNTPIAIGPDNLLLKLAPDRNASAYMAVFRAIVGPATAIAAVLGGYLAGAWSGSEFTLGPWAFGGLQLVFLLSFGGRILSLFFLAGVAEPDAHPLAYLVRVFSRSYSRRRARAVLALASAAQRPAAVELAEATSA
jgi:MFS family permease